MAARHSWEDDAGRSWEEEGGPPEGSDPEEQFSYDAVNPDAAGQQLADMLTDLKQRGTISAKQCCILAYWASKAGARGRVNALAFRPDCPWTGHYSRHFDSVMGTKPKEGVSWYELCVPSHRRFDDERSPVDLSGIPPLEAFEEEFVTKGNVADLLATAVAQKKLPPCYHAHPAVSGAPAGVPVFPLAIYIDAVAFTRGDSAIGFWVYCVLTGTRHLSFVLRRSEMCQCGCRGWCSLWPVFKWLQWSFQGMMVGVHPECRHDGSPFKASDNQRKACAGKPLGWRGALLFCERRLGRIRPQLRVCQLEPWHPPMPFVQNHEGVHVESSGAEPSHLSCCPEDVRGLRAQLPEVREHHSHWHQGRVPTDQGLPLLRPPQGHQCFQGPCLAVGDMWHSKRGAIGTECPLDRCWRAV